MEQNSLPQTTLRDLATVLVIVVELAWDGTRRVLRRVRPYIDPPPDLEVRSTKGAEYTGIILIDDNQILTGVVVRTGQADLPPLTSSFGTTRKPLVTTPPTDDSHSHREGYLRGWAEDTRDEEDAWYPRTQR